MKLAVNVFQKYLIMLLMLYQCTSVMMSYNRYGLHLSSNSYYICHDKERVKAIFQAMRDTKVSCVQLCGVLME